jgi:hypothetical protein
MQFITRAQWGARPPAWGPSRMNPAKGLFIHYNGPDPLPAPVVAGNFDAVCAHLRGVQQFHQGPQRGWRDIGYSWCVSGDGTIFELLGWGVEGAHTYGWNSSAHAIYLPLGGNQAPTPAQVEGVKRVIAEATARYGPQFVKGHQEANQTSCPGGPTMGLIRAGAFTPGQLAPRPPVLPAPPGVDPTVNKPFLCRMGDARVFIVWDGTPFRMHVKTPADVNVLRFFGLPDKGDIGATFLRFTHELPASA